MADKSLISLSVVIPVYASSAILPQLVAQLSTALKNIPLTSPSSSFEVVLVNDNSPDDSWLVVKDLCAKHPWIKGINLRKNAGQHNAVLTGLRFAQGKYIVMMDDDLQHDPKDITRIVDKLNQGFDVCYTQFKTKQHALWKQIGSKFNDLVANQLLNKPRGLYLSPFKGVIRSVRDEMIQFKGPYVYLDGLILATTNRIATVEIDHHNRFDGKSRYSLRKSVSLWLKMATSFSIIPLRIASILGLLFSIVGFMAAIALVVQRFTFNAMPVGWSSLIVTVLILGGLQLLALGLIGEYVGRVLLHVNGRPQAIIESTLNTVAE